MCIGFTNSSIPTIILEGVVEFKGFPIEFNCVITLGNWQDKLFGFQNNKVVWYGGHISSRFQTPTIKYHNVF
jgi:hypothetical protein